MTGDNSPDRLRAIFAKSGDCLPLEMIARIAGSPGGANADPVARSHFESCPYCRNEAAMLQEFESGSPRPEEIRQVEQVMARLRAQHNALGERNQSSARPSPFRSVLAWLAGAIPQQRWRVATAFACVLVAIGAGVYFTSGETGGFRSDPNASIVWRSDQVALVSPASEVAATPSVFEWRAVRSATIYHVRLLEVDQREIWSADTSSTQVAIPPEIRRQLTAGRSFLWQVIARDPRGVVADSNLQPFHISLIQP